MLRKARVSELLRLNERLLPSTCRDPLRSVQPQQPRSQQQRSGEVRSSQHTCHWLHAAGYSTALIGKYLNGFACSNAIPPVGRLGAGLQEHQSQYNYSIIDNGTLVAYGTTAADYQVDVLRDRAVASINRFATRTFRFSPTSRDGPARAAATTAAYKTTPVRRSRTQPAFNEADVSDKPP